MASDTPSSPSTGDRGYLQLEFDTAWRHLGGLENKRLWLFVGHGMTLAISLAALALAQTLDAGTWRQWLSLAIASWIVAFSLACRMVARSERLATERYRNKINLLRRTMLEKAADPRLWNMQSQGQHDGLQITDNPAKALRWADLLSRPRWSTALFMALSYDIAAVLGAALAVRALVAG